MGSIRKQCLFYAYGTSYWNNEQPGYAGGGEYYNFLRAHYVFTAFMQFAKCPECDWNFLIIRDNR